MTSPDSTEPCLLVDSELPVLHRPDGALQLGWGPDTARVVNAPEGMDSFDVGVLLRLLDGGRTRRNVLVAAAERGVSAEVAGELLDELVAAGTVRAAPAARSHTPEPPPRVRVCGAGPLAAALVGHLAMWDVHWSRSSLSTDSHRFRAGTTDCVVLTDAQVPDPHLVRTLMRQGVPHLTVRIRDGRGLIGPFVLPGRTSCLRCADLVRSDLDPSWPRLASQLCGRNGSGDRAIAIVTAGVAVGQLDAFLTNGPSTAPVFDRTLEVDLRSPDITTRRWVRHPDCGCSASVTLGQA